MQAGQIAAAWTKDSLRQLSHILQQAQRRLQPLLLIDVLQESKVRMSVVAHMSTFFRHSSPSSPSAHDPRAADRPSHPGGQKRGCQHIPDLQSCLSVRYAILNRDAWLIDLTWKSQSLLQWHKHRGCCQAKSGLPAVALSHRLPPASMVLAFVVTLQYIACVHSPKALLRPTRCFAALLSLHMIRPAASA